MHLHGTVRRATQHARGSRATVGGEPEAQKGVAALAASARLCSTLCDGEVYFGYPCLGSSILRPIHMLDLVCSVHSSSLLSCPSLWRKHCLCASGQRSLKLTFGHGSKSRTPSKHPNPHQNRLKWVVHLPCDPQPSSAVFKETGKRMTSRPGSPRSGTWARATRRLQCRGPASSLRPLAATLAASR